jgi:glycosyltransferase involved in cell wall biosynthesis
MKLMGNSEMSICKRCGRYTMCFVEDSDYSGYCIRCYEKGKQEEKEINERRKREKEEEEKLKVREEELQRKKIIEIEELRQKKIAEETEKQKIIRRLKEEKIDETRHMIDKSLPKVSVITVNRDGKPFLRECIESVLDQTYRNVSHVIVDNGSIGNDTEIIEEYRKKYPKQIKLIAIPNVNLPSAINIGIRNSSGDFIIHLDSDDYLELDAIEHLVNFLNMSKFYVVCGWYDEFNDPNFPRSGLSKDPNWRVEHCYKKLDKKKIFDGNFDEDSCLCQSTILIRKTAYERIGYRNPEYEFGDDLDFKIRVLENYELPIIPKIIFHRRLHSGQMSLTCGISDNERQKLNNLAITRGRERRRDKFKILIIIDEYGWAFDFAARGIQKYGRHDCIIKKWCDITIEDVKNSDVIFSMNYSCYDACSKEVKAEINKVKNKCVGIRGGQVYWGRIDSPINGWKTLCVTKESFDYFKSRNADNLFLCHNGVDDEIFKPTKKESKDRFVVGWVGNSKSPAKRFYILNRLAFPVKIINRHEPKFFVKGRTRDEMVEFYESIDCLVNVSKYEGMPQPVLEAAACGLPIVSTSVGGVPEFLDKEWLVPIESEDEMVKQINEKLQYLKDNPSMRKWVGKQNLEKVLDRWAWKHMVKEYEQVFMVEI